MDNLELKALFHMVAEHQDPPVKWNWKHGICCNIEELHEQELMSLEQVEQVESLIAEWAGNRDMYTAAFPVPFSPDVMMLTDNRFGAENADCYYLYQGVFDMYTGTYGRSRRELCLFIARNFKC